MSRGLLRAMCGATALSVLLMGGCPVSSEGIDLTERGVLSLVISRVSESSSATATGLVLDNDMLSLPYTEIVLADDQVLSVNDVPLTATAWTQLGVDAAVAATIEAVEAPDTYTISFDNQGTVTACEVTPPEDFSEVIPEASTEVTREGFELEWEPSGDDEVTVTVAISGLVLSYGEDWSIQIVEHSVSLTDLADDGAVTVGSAELYNFLAGDIGVALTRVKSISQKLGFSDGTIRLEIEQQIPLTLVETSSETGG